MKKNHAIHNEDACDFLLPSGKYNDWVITTAFYSSLHYVQHEMFPLKTKGKTYSNFELYYNSLGAKKPSKHSVTIDLVKKRLNKCYAHYRWLYDACMNSRYRNYLVSDPKAKQARAYLSDLKTHLCK